MIKIEDYKHISTVVEDTKRKIDQYRSGELKPLITSSKKEQEHLMGYFPSNQITIAARLGVGKTAKIISDMYDFCNPSLNSHYVNKIIILYDSWEMTETSNMLRFISRQGEIEVKNILDYKRKLSEERVNQLKAIADTFKGLPIFINTRPTTVKNWEAKKEQIQGQYPGYTIVNIFDHVRLVLKENESKEEELISGLMLAGIRIKNRFDMINIFLSQMNRSIETGVSRNQLGTSTPVLSDLFGSDSIGQCSDIVMALHRPGMYGLETFEKIPTGIDKNNPSKPDDLLLECIIKNRDGWTGNIAMKHNLAHNRIYDYDFNQNKPTGLTPMNEAVNKQINESNTLENNW
jgi:replicative DNA helicase